MAFNNEIEKTKKEIEVLTKKLSFLEELSQTKTPCEIAYKEVYGAYPMGEPFWIVFKKGYDASKVSETPQEPEELKTLYDLILDCMIKYNSTVYPGLICDILDAVEEWMSQYADNVLCGECKKGYEYCLTVLEENLK